MNIQQSSQTIPRHDKGTRFVSFLWVVFGLSTILSPQSAMAGLVFGGNDKKVWTDSKDWQGNTKAVNVSWSIKGQIQLGNEPGNKVFSTPYIYVPNSLSNTLVQIDTKTGRKRWLISLNKVQLDGDPSRTTVDANGDVWVGLRNGEKVVLVSKEGKIVRTVSVGLIPRAITIDLQGHIWVGAWGSNQIVRIDGSSGKITLRKELPCPYGSTTDIHGNIWFVSRCADTQSIIKMSPEGNRLGTYPAANAYGIATDAKGQVWVANYADGCVHRFTNNGSHLGCIPLENKCAHARGVAVDGNQNIWVACSNTPLVVKLNTSGRILKAITNLDSEIVGLAVDAGGFLWAISRTKATAAKINVKTHQVVGRFTTHGEGPYTYSDMTGFQIQSVAKSSEGIWRGAFSATCVSRWQAIKWNGQTPHGTTLTLRARSAPTKAALATAKWTSPLQNGARPNVPDNRWIEIEARLTTFNNKSTPILSQLVLEYTPAGIEVCNGEDDDCDGRADNYRGTPKPLAQDCWSSCGRGTRICSKGRWLACTPPSPRPEVCARPEPVNACDGPLTDGGTCPVPDEPTWTPTPGIPAPSPPPTQPGCQCQGSPNSSPAAIIVLLFLICALSWRKPKRSQTGES